MSIYERRGKDHLIGLVGVCVIQRPAGGLRPVPACAWIPNSPDFSIVDDQRRVPASVLRDVAILVPEFTRPSRSDVFHEGLKRSARNLYGYLPRRTAGFSGWM